MMHKKLVMICFLTLSLAILSGCKTQENIVSLHTQILNKDTNQLYFSGVSYSVSNQDNGLQKFRNTIPTIQKKEVIRQGMEGITKTGLAYVFTDLGARIEFDNYYSPLFDKTYTGELYLKDNPYSLCLGYTTIQVFVKNPNISLQQAIQSDHAPLLKFSELSSSEEKSNIFSGEQSLDIVNVYPLPNSPFLNQPFVVMFIMDKRYPERYYLITNIDASNQSISHFSITD